MSDRVAVKGTRDIGVAGECSTYWKFAEKDLFGDPVGGG